MASLWASRGVHIYTARPVCKTRGRDVRNTLRAWSRQGLVEPMMAAVEGASGGG